MGDRVASGWIGAMAGAACLLLMGSAARAECSSSDLSSYVTATAPKALAIAKDDSSCFLNARPTAKITDVINAALRTCEKVTGSSCRVAALQESAMSSPAPLVVAVAEPPPAPPPVASPPAKCSVARAPVVLGSEPVRVNPDGFCGLTVWYRHCIFLRQAGEADALGPYCPPEAKLIPGAVRAKQFPPDVEWIWSAEDQFTAFVELLSPDGALTPSPGGAPPMGSQAWRERCAKKYKSFDWNTGLYVAKGGDKRECALP